MSVPEPLITSTKNPRVKAALERVTGCVLVALGLRLATERR